MEFLSEEEHGLFEVLGLSSEESDWLGELEGHWEELELQELQEDSTLSSESKRHLILPIF